MQPLGQQSARAASSAPAEYTRGASQRGPHASPTCALTAAAAALQVVREQKMASLKAEQEDRVQRNLSRAAAPAFQKKKGKPDMARSILARRTRSAKAINESADAELDKFLARDFSRA